MISNNYIKLIGIYLVFSLIFLILIPFWALSLNLSFSILIFVSCAGGIGGILYAMRGFYQHIAQNDFDDKWFWWYLFRPFQGAIAGIFTYFFIAGGLIGIENLTQNKIYLIISLSFISGYGFTQFANSIVSIGRKII